MSQQQHSVLNAFDFAAIDEMDPALGNYHHGYHICIAEGHHLLYDREAPFELRIQDPNNGP
jgi:hypothetical protein